MADQASRDAILDAAEQLFAKQGFKATTIKQIGAAADVNPALLYYYFTDKETLYREMLRRLLGGFAEGALKQLTPDLDPREAIRRLVRAQVQFAALRPHVPRIIVREMIDHDAAHAEVQISALAAGLFARVCDIIREGQRTGLFRADVDPRFAAISTISQVVYFSVARPAVAIVLGERPDGPPVEVVHAFGEHAAEFAIAALSHPVLSSQLESV